MTDLYINNVKRCFVSPISTNDSRSYNLITRRKVDPWEIVWPYICQNLKYIYTFHEFTLHHQSKESTARDQNKPRHKSPLEQPTSDLPCGPRICKYGQLRSNITRSHRLQFTLSRCDNFPWRCFVAPTESHQCSTPCNAVRHTHLWCLQ